MNLDTFRKRRIGEWIISTQHIDFETSTKSWDGWMHTTNVQPNDLYHAPVIMVWDNRYREPFRMRFFRNMYMNEIINTDEWKGLKEMFPSMVYHHDDWNGYVTMSDSDIVLMRFHYP